MNRFVYGDDVSSEYPNVTVSIERITPEVARKMLEYNTHNRKLDTAFNHRSRNQILMSMEKDEWILDGATIVFDESGTLLDGQHRLTACMMSGKSFVTLVVRGVQTDAQESMDTNKSRSVKDQLYIYGVPNASSVAAVAKVLMLVSRNGVSRAFNGCRLMEGFTRKELIAFSLSHSEEIQDCLWPGRLKGVATVIPQNEADAFFYLFNMVSEEDAQFFFKDLASDVPTRQPIAKLKMTLMKAKLDRHAVMNRITRAAFVIKAWNAYRRGEDVRMYAFKRGGASRERFPAIDGFTESMRESIES